jgi:hypothetical protein
MGGGRTVTQRIGGGVRLARWPGTVLGGIAVLALLGAASALPSSLAFFVSALAVIFFPGMALTRLIARGYFDGDSLPERLAVWFVVGAGFVAAMGLLGLILRTGLRDVIVFSAVAYAALAALLIIRRLRSPDSGQDRKTRLRRPRVSPVTIIVICAALGLALITLLTPRDYDDWYYLAYISDYTSGARLASEDAIFDMGTPVTPRIWFGGGWWVFEATLARISGVDPVACHQIYLPLLLLPFVVLSTYTLARRLFRSAWAGLLACGFQMLFYLTSAYPYKSTGWMVFARIAQDKAAACFIVAPVAAALALRLLGKKHDGSNTGPRGLVPLYWMVVLTSLLIHGMGPVWAGILIVPLALVEWLRARSRVSALAMARTALPILASAAILVSMQGLVKEVVTAQPQDVIPAPGAFSGLYLPGMPFKLGTETTNPITWIFHEGFFTVNPLFIMRYPLAIAGLALTFFLWLFARSSLAARFLLISTASALLLIFTPLGVAIAASFITQRLAFRLVWVLPWGLTIAFILTRLRIKPIVTFLVLGAVTLALARGNPRNYGALFSKLHGRNRPSPDAVAAFGFLSTQPSPQGVVLASERTGRMIPAFLPDAYPVNFREYGPVDRKRLAQIVELEHMTGEFLGMLEQNHVRYILIENGKPLARALEEEHANFTLEYRNPGYTVWRKKRNDAGKPASQEVR